MTEKDMIDDFLNWQQPPASQMAITPTPKPDTRPTFEDRGEPKFVNPDRGEPTIQTPDIAYVDIQAPIRIAPTLPEHIALEHLTEKYRPLFNGTTFQLKDLEVEDVQKVIHSIDEKIEMLKVQKWAARVTYEGKVQLITDEKRKKSLNESNASFYISRKEKGAAKVSEKKVSPKQTANKFEEGIRQLVRMKMDEATIRKTLKDMGSEIPANLTAIISQIQLKG